MATFSWRQSRHRFDRFEYAGARLCIDQAREGVVLWASFTSHTCVDSVVFVRRLRYLKEVLWLEIRFFHSGSLIPM